ncbi:MAG: hypothetical protein K2M91_06565, partial [Lachnospiraceae bacterium]|nr:hypothetical protein [Lachnospiraceae bacterium]
MKNLKKAVVKRGICVLLTVAMLCTDTGVTVYATEGEEQKVLEETVEETLMGDMQIEDGQTKESSKVNERTEEDLAEEGETEETSPGKTPINEENTDENSGGENEET